MVFSLSETGFWLYGLWFLVAQVLCWYTPGSAIVQRLLQIKGNKNTFSAGTWIVIASALGMVLWAVQGYVFGYLELRWLSYVYVSFCILLAVKNWRFEQKVWSSAWQSLKKVHPLVLGMVALGVIIQVIQVAGSGLVWGEVIGFFRINAYDGVMHLAYINSLAQHFPPMEPGVVGVPLANYHYWSDLVMAELVRVWRLPTSHVFYQYLPLWLSVMTSVATYQAVRVFGGSKVAATLTLGLLLFGADVAYLIMLLLHGQWGFHISAIDNGATQFLNMPHVFAKYVFTAGLIPLSMWLTTKNLRYAVLTLCLFVPLVGFKIYFGLFAAMGFALALSWNSVVAIRAVKPQHSLLQSIKASKRSHLLHLFLGILYLVIAAAIYLPPNQGSGGLFWSPLEWPKVFISPENFNFPEWWLKGQVYRQHNNTLGLVYLDVIIIGMCLLSVFGSRLLGFIPNRSWYKDLHPGLSLFFVGGSVVFTLLGLYTLQTAGSFNVFNFFAVAAVALSILLGFSLARLLDSHRQLGTIAVLIVMVSSLPRIGFFATQAIEDYRLGHFEQIVSADSLQTYDFLRTQTPITAVIQTNPNNAFDRQAPITAFLSQRQTYLTGQGLLRTRNVPITEQTNNLQLLFTTTSSQLFAADAKKLGVSYIYLRDSDVNELQFTPITDDYMEIVFSTPTTMVLKVL